MPGRLQHVFFFLIVIITSLTIFTITARVTPYETCGCRPDHYKIGSVVMTLFQNYQYTPSASVVDYCLNQNPCPTGYILPIDLIILDIIAIAGFGAVVIKRRKTIIEQEFKRK